MDMLVSQPSTRTQPCKRIFTEKASGAQRERPELKAALEYLRQGDMLVVWKLDRLARSMRQLIETVEDLQTRGIELRSLTESIDTTTPGGRLVFHIFGALAEFECAVIRERTSAGLQAAHERGKKGGRPKTFGPKDIAVAKVLLADPNIRVEEVAARLKVSLGTSIDICQEGAVVCRIIWSRQYNRLATARDDFEPHYSTTRGVN